MAARTDLTTPLLALVDQSRRWSAGSAMRGCARLDLLDSGSIEPSRAGGFEAAKDHVGLAMARREKARGPGGV